LYKFKPGVEDKKIKAHIFGSGSIMQSALKAQEILAEKYGVSADVWSATSYKLLRTDAIRCQRWNMLHPTQPPKKSYVETLLAKETGRVRFRLRQHPHRARPDCAVGSRRFVHARHGRFWPQRHARAPCAGSLAWTFESTVIGTLYALAEKGQIGATWSSRPSKTSALTRKNPAAV
jgi:hypothetical protein